MPNGDSQSNTIQPTQPESLDNLIAEAERVQRPAIEHTPTKCSHAFDNPSIPTRKCKTCAFIYCDLCASILDPSYDKYCLNEPAAELKELPLRDADGVIHEGRHLQPAEGATFYQPRFGTLSKTISEMSDSELEDYVKQYIELVRQAERALDFRRVVLGSAQLEISQREHIKQRKLRADKTKYPVKTVILDPKTNKPVSKNASVAQLAQMMQALVQLKLLKDQQAKKKAAEAAAKAVDAKLKEPKL